MITGLLHRLYGVLATVAIPLVALGLLSSARGRRRFSERFGVWSHVGPVSWWLHGASVGEVQGLASLIKVIKTDDSAAEILLTATSPTGLERGDQLVNHTRLLPIDAPVAVRKALGNVQTQRFVVSETELWPTLLAEVHRTGIPTHIVNGRISDYTLRWYQRGRVFFAPLLRACTSISVPDQQQRERFISLGVEDSRVHVTGHTKYDSAPSHAALSFGQPGADTARGSSRRRFFPDSNVQTPIVVLGSLREGEQQIWFGALKRAWQSGMQLRVIVAPRHAERFEFFWGEIQRLGQRATRWSAGEKALARGHDLLLLDTMGLLEEAYAVSDLAFVGATLVDIGGHNPLEPAMYGVPVVVGPYTSVINEPVSRMRAEGGIIEVRSEVDVFDLLGRIASRDSGLDSVGRAGYSVYSQYRGAADRVLAVITESEGRR
ncbi:MAG: 3-deoxy-D-manno-octulosonic acid transferase [Pseudomonadota bacterium]|jgi:3-deoxy-D-manno-octulosonic-acid transferase